MTLVELLTIANQGYADQGLTVFFDPQTGEAIDAGGDTLALFIVRELGDTFKSATGRAEQLDAAMEILKEAVADLQSVIVALDRAKRQP